MAIVNKRTLCNYNRANKEIETMKRRSDSDVTVLNAALRRAEVHIESLQQTIEQKVFRLKIIYTVIQSSAPN